MLRSANLVESRGEWINLRDPVVFDPSIRLPRSLGVLGWRRPSCTLPSPFSLFEVRDRLWVFTPPTWRFHLLLSFFLVFHSVKGPYGEKKNPRRKWVPLIPGPLWFFVSYLYYELVRTFTHSLLVLSVVRPSLLFRSTTSFLLPLVSLGVWAWTQYSWVYCEGYPRVTSVGTLF